VTVLVIRRLESGAAEDPIYREWMATAWPKAAYLSRLWVGRHEEAKPRDQAAARLRPVGTHHMQNTTTKRQKVLNKKVIT